MAKYSEEWIKESGDTRKPDFSIAKEFKKLRDGQSISLTCDGYGITEIIDRDGDCYLVKDGEKISYEDLIGKSIDKGNRNLYQLGLGIAIIWFVSAIIIYFIFRGKGYEARGTFGDMFGAVNALFSGLALGGIIFTIHLQKKELKLQRKELRDTRKEFSIQNETLKIQKFENTFFSLISNHLLLVDTIPPKGKKKDFPSKNQSLIDLGKMLQDRIEAITKIIVSKELSNFDYQRYYPEENSNVISDYSDLSDNLLFIIDFIKVSQVKSKDLYFNILYHSLSSYEKFVFGYFIEFELKEKSFDDTIKPIYQKKYLDKTDGALLRNNALPPIVRLTGMDNRASTFKDVNSKNFKEKVQEIVLVLNNLDSTPIHISNLTIRDLNSELYKEVVDIDLNANSDLPITPFENFQMTFDSLKLSNPSTASQIYFKLSLNKPNEEIYTLEKSIVFDIVQNHNSPSPTIRAMY